MTRVQTGTIETRIPSRLDRLPWSGFHWRIVFGLGTAWVLDGLEVTMVASVGSRLTEHGAGLGLSVSGVGLAGAIYITGACLGALFFGQLCDRFGRKKLFLITLGLYIVSTVATAFSFAPWFFFAARFLTGAGIGGEYSAINSAIDELIPARARGRVDLVINGSYWFGSILGSAAALFFLSGIFPVFFGWRLAFGVGAVIGLAVLFVRRKVPESPRWLFIHGREDEAEAIVAGVEEDTAAETGQELDEVDKAITVRQRTTIPFREIARVAWKLYPRRAILCLALFVGQAFLYNGITFNLGTLMTGFYKISSSLVPVFIIIYAAGNLAGPLVLGRLFDTIGRKPMISGTYLGSALLGVVLAGLFVSGSLTSVTFIIVVVAVFFLASAGASAAYLTASEIFPMETRALAIAFFYAIGTAVGGISGPLLFGSLIASGAKSEVAIGFLIGAAVMALGGAAELLFGVRAAGQQLEDVARPLTAAGAEAGGTGSGEQPAEQNGSGAAEEQPQPGPQRTVARHFRELAARERARAAEHRAAAHEQLAEAGREDGRAEERAGVERLLAEIAEVTAQADDERAAAADERADADSENDGHLALAATERARAGEERARARDQEAEALASGWGLAARRHRSLAEAASERGRSREQRGLAEQARAAAAATSGDAAAIEEARAGMHDAWAAVHVQRARVHEAESESDVGRAARAGSSAEALGERAQAAAERLDAAEHRAEARGERQEEATAEDAGQRREEAASRQAAEDRARARAERRRERERAGLRRYRPGPGSMSASRGWALTAPDSPRTLDSEVRAIERALDEHGPTGRRELAQLVGSRYWGPGVFGAALREAIAEGQVGRVSRATFAVTGSGPDRRDTRQQDGEQNR